MMATMWGMLLCALGRHVWRPVTDMQRRRGRYCERNGCPYGLNELPVAPREETMP